MDEDKQIEKRIGYRFKSPELLVTAMSHRSVSNHNNERLEFLGDSILNFVIAEALFQQWPTAQEGDLSRLRAMLVKGDTLAEVAKGFKLSAGLRLGTGELKSGGQHRTSILADALEAVIAAIYQDSDFEVCKQIILSWFKTRIDELPLNSELKDPKTRLQEFLQGRQIDLPQYEITLITGEAHNQRFNVACQVPQLNIQTEGFGSSRRKAEQDAADKCLKQLLEAANA